MNESILSSYSPAQLMINADEDSFEDEEIYPEDEIDDDADDVDERREDQDDDHLEEDEEEEQQEQRRRTSITPPPPPPPSIPSAERGGRRKGVPKRLQIADDRLQSSTIPKCPPTIISTSFNVEQEENLQHRSSSYYHHGKNFDENNNEEENTLEIVDDLLADLVTEIVRKIREERQQKFENKPKLFHNKQEEKFVISTSTHSIPTANKSPMLFNEINKTKPMKSSRSPPPPSIPSKISSTSTGNPVKRPKLSNDPSLSLQHQQLLWQMTQQFLMPNSTNDIDTSSLLKQQLLGVNPPTKRSPGRPPKHSVPPQAMRSSTNMTASPISQTSNFAPRRRGRPPKYVTERPTNPSNDFDQLFAAIENSVSTNPNRATFQTALASMLTQPAATRNGTPASMMKQSAGQTRQTMTNPTDFNVNIPKKRGPGRPPKNQTLVNSHATNGNFAPTMVPSSPSSFDFNAALIEMFQQQQQQQQQHSR